MTLLAALARALLHRPTSAEAAGEALGYGCGTALFLGLLFYGLRSLLTLARGTGQRSPLISCLVGLPAAVLVVAVLLVGDALGQARIVARIKVDMAAAMSAIQQGKPLPNLDPDPEVYGAALPLMRHTWGKLQSCSAIQREVLADQNALGSPLDTPSASDPEKVDSNVVLLKALLPKIDRFQESLDEVDGPQAIQAVEALPIDSAMKAGFRKAQEERAGATTKTRESMKASKELMAQILEMLLIVQRDRPTADGDKLRFNRTENLEAYRQAQVRLQALVALNNRLLAELRAMQGEHH